MNATEILAYYSREEVQEALLKAAKEREVVGVYRTGAFGQRPNTLLYPQDILSQVRSGVVEFHYSPELWDNPLTLQRRKGFDILFDLDCRVFEHGKIAASVLGWALEKHGIKHASVKFSGNQGFHVGIPWNSLPKEVDFQPTASLFPESARSVGLYIRSFMRDRLERALLKHYSLETLAEQVEKPLGSLLTKEGMDPFKIVDIDPVLISPRHLVRMPYSLNKKAFLVSLPLKKEDLEDFNKDDASPRGVKVEVDFLAGGKEGEAELLFAEALDWSAQQKIKEKPLKKRSPLKRKIPQELFPPCIKTIQKGLADGRKRSVFILINFLRSLKWNWEEIASFLKEWNTKNKPPLREQYLVTQLRYYRDKKQFPPPNCYQEGWYVSFGVCSPDHICVTRENIKNPVNYPFRLMKRKKATFKS